MLMGTVFTSLKWLILLLLISFSSFLNAQTEVTVIDGDGQDQYLPYSNYYYLSYTQQIYLPSEVQGTGEINRISIKYNGDKAFDNELKVYLSHTTKSSFSSKTDWIDVNEMKLVFDGNVILTTTDGWVDILLDSIFTYNGTDNLVLAMDENSSASVFSGTAMFYHGTVSDNRSIYFVLKECHFCLRSHRVRMKKYGQKRLKRLLADMYERPMVDQKASMERIIKAWEKKMFQVDDRCVIGIRL